MLLPFFAYSASAQEPEYPNVLLVVADDLGWRQMGCYGSDYYQTPHLDSFAKSGVKFTNAYAAAPVCSPTRAALFTGKNPGRLHITNFIPEPGIADEFSDQKLQIPEWQKYLPLEEITLAEVLHKSKYRTALFGKWHLSASKYGNMSLPFNPDKQGFDETFLTFKPSRNMPLSPWQKPELDAHSTDTITNRAIEFIRKKDNHPFFVVVSYDAVHNPLMEKEETIKRYRESEGNGKPEDNPVLAAMIERLDLAFGRLINSLTANEILGNTIVIFISDNGGLENDASQSPLKRGKGWLYEGGIRVPMMVAWNNKVDQGQVCSVPVITEDIFPTILELAGIKYPIKNMDGTSIVPLLRGGKPLKRRTLFWNFPHYHYGPPSAAVRKDNMKLIEWYEKSLSGEQKTAFELYDLETDPGETKNLADSLKFKTKKLAGELQKWRQKISAQIPRVGEISINQ